MIFDNPEIQRYRWLELSTHRLVVTPILLGIILFLVADEADVFDAFEALARTSEYIFYGFALLWGGHKAAEAVVEEVNDRTWDFQRLSATSPWYLALGKLFGSTMFPWYGALMALVVYAVCANAYLSAYYVFCNVVLLLAGGVLCHAVAVLSGLMAVRSHAGSRKKIRVGIHHAAGVLVASQFMFALKSRWEYQQQMHPYVPPPPPPGSVDNMGFPPQPTPYDPYHLSWYGWQFDTTLFMALVSVVLMAWAVFGVYWLMRGELRMRTGPLVFAGFMVFMMLLISGLTEPSRLGYGWLSGDSRMFVAYGIGLTFLYGMAFLEGWSGVTYRQFMAARALGRSDKAAELFPRWVVAFALTGMVALVSMLWEHSLRHVWIMATPLLFAIRDIGVLHYFRLNPDNRRALMSAGFYLGVLYVIIPLLLKTLGLKSFLLYVLAVPANLVVVPDFGQPQVDAAGDGFKLFSSMLSGFVQASIAMWLVRRQWLKYWR